MVKGIKTPLSCLFIISMFAIATPSCNNIKDGHIAKAEPEIVNLDSAASHCSLASLVDSVKAIELETTDSSVISDVYSIKRIIFKDDKFFVLDQKFFSIKVFDSKGKYLYDISRLGLGKGQSLHIDDIELNFPHNLLMALSNRPLKTMAFTFDGHLIKEENLDFFASQFAFPSPDSRIFYVNQNKSELSQNKNILFTDSNNVIKGRMFDSPKNITSVILWSGGLYSTSEKKVYFNPAFSDTIYVLHGDTATPAYKIYHGTRGIPAGLPEAKLSRDINNYSLQSATFIKYMNYIGFNYQSGPRYAAFYNTRSNKSATSDIQSDSLNILFSNYMFENDGKLLMILDINRLSGFIERNAAIIQQRFPDVFSHLHLQKSQRNPVLLTFTLRNI